MIVDFTNNKLQIFEGMLWREWLRWDAMRMRMSEMGCNVLKSSPHFFTSLIFIFFNMSEREGKSLHSVANADWNIFYGDSDEAEALIRETLCIPVEIITLTSISSAVTLSPSVTTRDREAVIMSLPYPPPVPARNHLHYHMHHLLPNYLHHHHQRLLLARTCPDLGSKLLGSFLQQL